MSLMAMDFHKVMVELNIGCGRTLLQNMMSAKCWTHLNGLSACYGGPLNFFASKQCDQYRAWLFAFNENLSIDVGLVEIEHLHWWMTNY